MYNYIYKSVTSEDMPNDVAFHNMEQADNMLNLDIFISAALGYFNTNSNKTFYDLENELRKKNFNTHLIACKSYLPKGYILCIPNTDLDIKCKYECIFSCRPNKYAFQEVLQNWNTYEENLEALKSSGIISVNNYSNIENEISAKLLQPSIKDIMNNISKNKIKVFPEEININQILQKKSEWLRVVYNN